MGASQGKEQREQAAWPGGTNCFFKKRNFACIFRAMRIQAELRKNEDLFFILDFHSVKEGH